MPFKILYLITDLNIGGTEKQLAQLAMGLSPDHFEPIIAGLKGWGHTAAQLQEAGLEVHALGEHGGNLLTVWKKLQALQRRYQPDLIHTFLFRANIFGRFLAHRSTPQPRMISSIRVWDDRRLPLFLERCTINWTDMVIFNSSWVAAQFCRATGLDDHRCRVIPNGIDPEPYRLAQVNRRSVRLSLGIDDSNFSLVCAGRLDRQKGYPYLLEAFRQVSRRHPEARLVIAGDGPDRLELEKQVKSLNLSNSVKLLGFRSDIPELLAAADCFVLASLWEGSPNVVLEAWAAGRPVVASATPGAQELIQEGKTGLLVPAANSSRLAQAILQIMETPAKAQEMARNADKELDRRSMTNTNEATQNIYRELLA